MKIGLQMYSVRENLARDPVGTMTKVAEMGYKYWENCDFSQPGEPANYGLYMPAAEGKAFIDGLGVKVIGCHFAIGMYADEKRFGDFLDYQAAVDCLSPGLAINFYNDVDDIKRKCEIYNCIGEMCKERGMVFHYHNHFHEFQLMEGKYVVDHILENTDPELVKFELDTYWAACGGAKPIDMIYKYSDRLLMLHQKDIPQKLAGHENMFESVATHDMAITEEQYWACRRAAHYFDECLFAEVGTGVMDIQSIIDAAVDVGVPYMSLEQDKTDRDELESVQISMDAFRNFDGVEWR